jgi:hypothetical protein
MARKSVAVETGEMVTNTREDGLSHAYPARHFKPEAAETKTADTPGRKVLPHGVDHTLFACVSLLAVGAVSWLVVKNFWLGRKGSAGKATEPCEVELLAQEKEQQQQQPNMAFPTAEFVDLEDNDPPIDGQPTWASPVQAATRL